MAAGAQYGLLLGAEMILLVDMAPQPWGAVLFWSIQAVQLTLYTTVLWRRTRLVLSTLGGIAASLAAVLLAGLHTAGSSLDNLSSSWAAVIYTLIAVAPLSLLAESCVHRVEWTEWKHHMEGMGLSDVLLLRHIPRLHRRGA
jgi:hypothetical protein